MSENKKEANKESEVCTENYSARPWWTRIFDVGVVVHELGHYFGALVTESKVVHVTLLDKHGGGVVHMIATPLKSFIIALMPFLLSNTLAFILLADAIRAYNSYNFPYFIFALWLGVSISLSAHPSAPDLLIAIRKYKQSWRNASLLYKVLILLLSPFIITALAAMLLKHYVFERPITRWLWIAITIAIANAYVVTLG